MDLLPRPSSNSELWNWLEDHSWQSQMPYISPWSLQSVYNSAWHALILKIFSSIRIQWRELQDTWLLGVDSMLYIDAPLEANQAVSSPLIGSVLSGPIWKSVCAYVSILTFVCPLNACNGIVPNSCLGQCLTSIVKIELV